MLKTKSMAKLLLYAEFQVDVIGFEENKMVAICIL